MGSLMSLTDILFQKRLLDGITLMELFYSCDFEFVWLTLIVFKVEIKCDPGPFSLKVLSK